MSRMKFVLPLLTFFLIVGCKDNPSNTEEPETPTENTIQKCENGLIDEKYECKNFDLLANISKGDLGDDRIIYDMWGWTDTQSNSDYVLLALSSKVLFIEVTDPLEPQIIGELPESKLDIDFTIKTRSDATNRAIKTYSDHLFVISDGQPHGMQVFDLTNLRDYSDEYLTFTEDALYEGAYNARNIEISEESGFAYLSGVIQGEDCSKGGLHIVNINEPKSPTYAGCYDADFPSGNSSISPEYTYNSNCFNYDGPDPDYQNRELCFLGKGNAFVIVDVTEKASITLIDYVQQWNNYSTINDGAFSPSLQYYFLNPRGGANIYIWDISDLDNPTFYTNTSDQLQGRNQDLQSKNTQLYLSNREGGFYLKDYSNINFRNFPVDAYFGKQSNRVESQDRTDIRNSYIEFEDFIALSDSKYGVFLLELNLSD